MRRVTKKRRNIKLAILLTFFGGMTIQAANNALDTVYVYADKDQVSDKFGNVATEQSYYRTGGDVTVISKKEIESKHYVTFADIIRNVPGVTVSDTGFHGGMYGGGTYTTDLQINGDGHVVILMDGRRLDNGAGNFASHQSYGNSKNTMALYLLNNLNLVDCIEVIKGPGASIYGADATGGAINIITKKGMLKSETTLDISTGSWGHHRYAIGSSGANEDGNLRYYIAANRDISGDTHYKDGLTNKNRKFIGTAWKDSNTTIRLDKDFNDSHGLSFFYNYSYDYSGMPLTAPDYRYLNNLLNDTLYHAAGGDYGWHNSDFWSKGYRNWFIYEGYLGSYTETISRNMDLTYTFKRNHGMDSFVRVFDERTTYWNNRRGRLWGLSQAKINDLISRWDTQTEIPQWSTRDREFKTGIQLQLGKQYGKHDVLGGLTYSHNKWDRIKPNDATNYFKDINGLKRDVFTAYVQDKIHPNDKWEVTPAIRYDNYGNYSIGTFSGKNKKEIGKYSHASLMFSTQYLITPSFSTYFSWAQVNRSLGSADFSQTFEVLKNEKGNAYNFGFKKFTNRIVFDVNYSYIDMSNAIGQYSVVDAKGKVATRAINAMQEKRAINLGLHQKLSERWKIGLSYSYVHDKFSGKHVTVDPDVGTSVDVLINSIRPVNKYNVDIEYKVGNFDVNFNTAIYSGMNTKYFTNNRFIVSRLSGNYRFNDNLSMYVVADNLFNESWENKYYSLCNIGAFPQVGRNFMIGVKYEF